MKVASAAIAALLATFALCAAALTGWMLMASGASGQSGCPSPNLDDSAVPAELSPLFAAASKAYGLEPEGPAILAGLTKVESDFGRNMGPSSAGAIGWTQFMPGTWKRYGVDADGDGKADPMTAADAILSAARYLKALEHRPTRTERCSVTTTPSGTSPRSSTKRGRCRPAPPTSPPCAWHRSTSAAAVASSEAAGSSRSPASQE